MDPRIIARMFACAVAVVTLSGCTPSPDARATGAPPAPRPGVSGPAGVATSPVPTAPATPPRPPGTAGVPSPVATPTRRTGATGLSRPGDHRLPAGTVTLRYDVSRAATTPLRSTLQQKRAALRRGTGVAIYLAGGTSLDPADLTAIQRLGRSASEGGAGLTNLSRLAIYNLRSLPGGRECRPDSGLACAGQQARGGHPYLYFNGWWNSWVRHLVLDDLLRVEDGAFSNTDFATVSFRSARSVGVMGFGHGPYSDLTELYLPNVTTIAHDAFRRNQYLARVRLPKVRTIDDFAFDDNSRLESFEAPNLVSIGRNALNDSHVLRTVHLPRVEYIGINCFDLNGDARAGTGVRELRLPRLRTLDKNAITGFASLRKVYAPELRTVWHEAITDNPNLEEIYAPKLTKIGPDAFANNPRLKRLVVGKRPTG